MPSNKRIFKTLSLRRRIRIILRLLDGELVEDLADEYNLTVPDLERVKKVFRKREEKAFEDEQVRYKDPDELLTRKEAAALLKVKEETLNVWKAVGRYNLPCVKVGRSVRYRRADIEAFIKNRTTT